MKRKLAGSAALILVLSTLAACGAGPSDDARPSSAPAVTWNPPPVCDAPEPEVRLETVAAGLEVPWAMAFAPDGRIFVTERRGRIRVIENGSLRSEPWAVLDVTLADYSLEAGLMGIALAPDFTTTGHVYVVATFDRPIGTLERVRRRAASMLGRSVPVRHENRILRLTDRDGRGTEPETIVAGLGTGHFHAGGALAFGADGMLYSTLGDRFEPDLAADPLSPSGGVLRYRPDGGLPEDNPFPGSPVWAYGLRNPQGLAWHPATGDLFAIEHGPSGLEHEGGRFGRDELNVIRPGGNYGWPVASGMEGDARHALPVVEWTPAIAPGGLAVYDADAVPEWKGDLLVAGLRGHQLRRIAVVPPTGHDDGWSVRCESILVRGAGRIRAVAVGPDGFVHFTTSNRDGRATPGPADDRLIRIVPVSR